MAKKINKNLKDENEMNWDEIGKVIGSKIEKGFKNPGCSWKGPWVFNYQDNGGGFGRFLFSLGMVLALYNIGLLTGIPIWTIIMIIIGFSMMRF